MEQNIEALQWAIQTGARIPDLDMSVDARITSLQKYMNTLLSQYSKKIYA